MDASERFPQSHSLSCVSRACAPLVRSQKNGSSEGSLDALESRLIGKHRARVICRNILLRNKL